ncbi:hypothetical protein [Pseudactinotalea sp.]|uniref:hypothetical protein n=1 Tax=Pseudactinotalea sp. TaxID=1926260 RepID=UPI003B3AEBCF
MDISDTLAPKSDQMDYVDLIAGPKTLTIKAVRRGPSPDQPVQIDFEEFDRPWRPAKTVRRVLAACWGTDSTVYVGRRVTLYGDPTVKFAGQEVGGIRLSHASHIEAPVTAPLMIARGKSAPFTVQPLTDVPAPPDGWEETLAGVKSLPALQAYYDDEAHAWFTPEVRDAFTKRKEELT